MENKDMILFVFKLRLELGQYDKVYNDIENFKMVKVTDFRELEKELNKVGYSLEEFNSYMNEFDFSDNALFNRDSPINRMLIRGANEFLIDRILFIDRLRHDLLKKDCYPIDIIERYFKGV